MLEVEIEEAIQPLAEEWAAMTFPRFHSLLELLGTDQAGEQGVRPVACCARAGGRPAGLVIAKMPTAIEPAAEILSIFVAPDLRHQGIATYLIAGLEQALVRRGAPRILGVYMTSQPSLEVIERLFAKCGYSAPARRTLVMRFTPEEASNTRWYQRARLPKNCTIFPWNELTPDELETLKRTQAESAWIPHELEPWRFDKGCDPLSSVGMRRNGEVVGWVINQWVARNLISFSVSFMRADLARRGRIFPLYVASIKRLRGRDVMCTFLTASNFEPMIRFVLTRCAPFATFCGETRGVMKDLPRLPDAARECDVNIVEDFGDRDQWDEFVAASPNGSFFQSWGWGEVQKKMGARTERVAAVCDGRIVGCVQTFVFDSGSKKFAYVPLGPVADPDDEGVAGALLTAIAELGGRERVYVARIEPEWPDQSKNVQLLRRHGFVMAKQHIMAQRSMLVDLKPPVEDIWSSFRSNTRNRIRLATKRGVEVRVGGPVDTEAFVQVFEETIRRHDLGLSSIAAFRFSVESFGASDAMRLYLASSEGVDIAGIVVFVFGKRAIYLWGGSSASSSARKVNPNQLLQWTAMQWARECGCTTYDMTGIPDYDEDVLEANYHNHSEGWWSLYRFKRGFRGRVDRRIGTFDWLFERHQPASRD